MMSSASVQLLALDVLDAALEAGTLRRWFADEGPRADALRDLEVLPREDLIRVAMAIAAEATLHLTPSADRPRLQERVQRLRLRAMWAAS